MSFSRSLFRPNNRFLSPLNPNVPVRSFHFGSIKPRPHSASGHSAHTPPRTTPHSAHGHTSNTTASGLGGAAGSKTGQNGGKKPSPHLLWYRELVPAMVPIILLATTICLSLRLLRTHLSHNLALDESAARIAELETQLDRLRKRQARQRERDRRERERILPLVVERVLQKVGAMAEEEEEEEELPLLV